MRYSSEFSATSLDYTGGRWHHVTFDRMEVAYSWSDSESGSSSDMGCADELEELLEEEKEDELNCPLPLEDFEDELDEDDAETLTEDKMIPLSVL